jgi:transposase-like protein
MRAYSEDLREEIVAAIERGMPKAQAARALDVSLSSVKRYARMARRGESLTPKKSPGRPPRQARNPSAPRGRRKGAPGRTRLPKAPLPGALTGSTLSDSTVRRLMKRLGFSQKTDSGGAGTRRLLESRPEGYLRRADRAQAANLLRRDGYEHSLSATYGWAKKGRRAYRSVPRNHGKNTTLLASSKSVEGMGPSLAVEGATDRRGLRDVRGAGPGAESARGSGGGHG